MIKTPEEELFYSRLINTSLLAIGTGVILGAVFGIPAVHLGGLSTGVEAGIKSGLVTTAIVEGASLFILGAGEGKTKQSLGKHRPFSEKLRVPLMVLGGALAAGALGFAIGSLRFLGMPSELDLMTGGAI